MKGSDTSLDDIRNIIKHIEDLAKLSSSLGMPIITGCQKSNKRRENSMTLDFEEVINIINRNNSIVWILGMSNDVEKVHREIVNRYCHVCPINEYPDALDTGSYFSSNAINIIKMFSHPDFDTIDKVILCTEGKFGLFTSESIIQTMNTAVKALLNAVINTNQLPPIKKEFIYKEPVPILTSNKKNYTATTVLKEGALGITGMTYTVNVIWGFARIRIMCQKLYHIFYITYAGEHEIILRMIKDIGTDVNIEKLDCDKSDTCQGWLVTWRRDNIEHFTTIVVLSQITMTWNGYNTNSICDDNDIPITSITLLGTDLTFLQRIEDSTGLLFLKGIVYVIEPEPQKILPKLPITYKEIEHALAIKEALPKASPITIPDIVEILQTDKTISDTK